MTAQGFDENDNPVSFRPCPSGQVWTGFKCLNHCTVTKTLTTTGLGYLQSHSLGLPGLRINSQCRPICHNTTTSLDKSACFFVPNLNVYLLITHELKLEIYNLYSSEMILLTFGVPRLNAKVLDRYISKNF